MGKDDDDDEKAKKKRSKDKDSTKKVDKTAKSSRKEKSASKKESKKEDGKKSSSSSKRDGKDDSTKKSSSSSKKTKDESTKKALKKEKTEKDKSDKKKSAKKEKSKTNDGDDKDVERQGSSSKKTPKRKSSDANESKKSSRDKNKESSKDKKKKASSLSDKIRSSKEKSKSSTSSSVDKKEQAKKSSKKEKLSSNSVRSREEVAQKARKAFTKKSTSTKDKDTSSKRTKSKKLKESSDHGKKKAKSSSKKEDKKKTSKSDNSEDTVEDTPKGKLSSPRAKKSAFAPSSPLPVKQPDAVDDESSQSSDYTVDNMPRPSQLTQPPPSPHKQDDDSSQSSESSVDDKPKSPQLTQSSTSHNKQEDESSESSSSQSTDDEEPKSPQLTKPSASPNKQDDIDDESSQSSQSTADEKVRPQHGGTPGTGLQKAAPTRQRPDEENDNDESSSSSSSQSSQSSTAKERASVTNSLPAAARKPLAISPRRATTDDRNDDECSHSSQSTEEERPITSIVSNPQLLASSKVQVKRPTNPLAVQDDDASSQSSSSSSSSSTDGNAAVPPLTAPAFKPQDEAESAPSDKDQTASTLDVNVDDDKDRDASSHSLEASGQPAVKPALASADDNTNSTPAASITVFSPRRASERSAKEDSEVESSQSSSDSEGSQIVSEKKQSSQQAAPDEILNPTATATAKNHSEPSQSSGSDQPNIEFKVIQPHVVEVTDQNATPVIHVDGGEIEHPQSPKSSDTPSSPTPAATLNDESHSSSSSESISSRPETGNYGSSSPTMHSSKPDADNITEHPNAEQSTYLSDGTAQPAKASVAEDNGHADDGGATSRDRDEGEHQSSQSSHSSRLIVEDKVAQAAGPEPASGNTDDVDEGGINGDTQTSTKPATPFECSAFRELLQDCSLVVNHPDQPPVSKKGNFQHYNHPNFCLTTDGGDDDDDNDDEEKHQEEEGQCLSLTVQGKGGRCELRHHALWGVAAARYSTSRAGVILCSTTMCLVPSPQPHTVDSLTLLQILHTSYDLPSSGGASLGGSKPPQLFAKTPLLRIVWCREEGEDDHFTLWAVMRRLNKERRYKIGPKQPGSYFDLDIWIVYDPDSENYELGIDLDEDNCLMKDIDDWLSLTPTSYFQIGCKISDKAAPPDSSAQVLYRKLDINIPTGEPLDEETDDDSDSEESDEEEPSWAENSYTEGAQESTNGSDGDYDEGGGEEVWEEESVSDDGCSRSSSGSYDSRGGDETEEHRYDEVSVTEDQDEADSDGSSSYVSDVSEDENEEWAEVSESEDQNDEEEEGEEETDAAHPKAGRHMDYDEIWAEISVSDEDASGHVDETMGSFTEYSAGSHSDITINSTGSAFYLPVDESEANDLLQLADRKHIELVIARQRMVEKEDNRGYSKVAALTDLSGSLYQAVKSACAGTRVFVLGKEVKKKLKDGDMIGYMRYGKGDNVRKISFQTCKKTPLKTAIDEVLPVTEKVLPVLISYELVIAQDDEEELSD